MPTDWTEDRAPVTRFTERYLEDRKAGTVRTLQEYSGMFPGNDEALAAEYLALRRGESRTEASEGGRIGPYRLLRILGAGGMGEVWLAEQEKPRRLVAVKVLLAGTVRRDTLRRFEHEAELLGRLQHPGIAHVYDAGVDSRGQAFIAMKYVEGQSLAQWLQASDRPAEGASDATYVIAERPDGPRPAPTSSEPAPAPAAPATRGDLMKALRLVEKTARALHAAHEKGVIHRDVKPGNIMVSEDSEPVLLDFGLAREMGGELPTLTQTGDVFGTPAYMSPEQIAGKRIEVDRRTDVWSLGVVLYECVTQRRPFEAQTREGLYQQILREEPTSPHRLNPILPRDLGTVILTALDKDPDRRYQTALDLAEDLRRVRNHEPVQVRPPTPWIRLRRWTQRNPALAASLAAAALILIAGTVTSLTFAFDAATNARREKAAAERAQRERANVFRLSAFQRLEDLRSEADRLWPLDPELAPLCEEWLRRAEALVAGLTEPDPTTGAPSHREQLAALERRARHAAGEHGSDAAPPLHFATEDDRWWHAQLSKLVSELEELADPEIGLMSGVSPAFGWGIRRRLDYLRTVNARSLEDTSVAEDWAAARVRVATDPRYAGLVLTPQRGLVPLGRDPDSDLEEFAEIAAGTPPARDPDTGRLQLTEDSGLVFVLIPGGTFTMGAQRADPGGPNHHPDAEPYESPLQDVTLSPFYLSKYEMTQGQWLRLTGANPSPIPPGTSIGEKTLTLLNPVNQVSWEECARVLPRIGLLLPTESQWEYGCRGGTSTPWSCASTDLPRSANLADAWCRAHGGPEDWEYETWSDGHVVHAPAGSFAPNPLGLHDVHGNVWEWCRDRWGAYGESTPRSGDGLRTAQSGSAHICRGGSFNYPATRARSAYRDYNEPSNRLDTLGCRPARAITP